MGMQQGRLRKKKKKKRRLRRQRRAQQQHQQRLDEARRRLEELQQRQQQAADARRRLEELRQRLEELRQELQRLAQQRRDRARQQDAQRRNALPQVQARPGEVLFLPRNDANRPMTNDELARMPKVRIDQPRLERVPECPICLEPFRPNQEVIELDICRHIYHRVCLSNWFRISSACPMCRRQVNPREWP